MSTLIRGHERGLYISERGEVVCAEDAPDGDTWRWGHYIRVTEGFERLWHSENARVGSSTPLRCEVCDCGREEAEVPCRMRGHAEEGCGGPDRSPRFHNALLLDGIGGSYTPGPGNVATDEEGLEMRSRQPENQ